MYFAPGPPDPATRLAAVIADTTLNPMDYMTNGPGSTRPNSFHAANSCYTSHTIGMPAALKASVCADISANSLYQQAQAYTTGFFQPGYNN
jgi:hypothetical protein